jgi:hypothetical protein
MHDSFTTRTAATGSASEAMASKICSQQRRRLSVTIGFGTVWCQVCPYSTEDCCRSIGGSRAAPQRSCICARIVASCFQKPHLHPWRGAPAKTDALSTSHLARGATLPAVNARHQRQCCVGVELHEAVYTRTDGLLRRPADASPSPRVDSPLRFFTRRPLAANATAVTVGLTCRLFMTPRNTLRLLTAATSKTTCASIWSSTTSGSKVACA